ncbi:MAG: hypothetical protein ACE5E6_09165 [Phycisphaerae bacterium]
MPRPNKTFTRQRINAGIAYKRGDKKEAYKLWDKAAAGLKELRDAKRKRHHKGDKPEDAETQDAGA